MVSKITDGSLERPGSISPVPENNSDGVEYYASLVDLEDNSLILKVFSELSMNLFVDTERWHSTLRLTVLIEDIVNEAIVSDLYESPVQVELSNVNASEKVKNIIRDEFKYIKELLGL